MKKKFENIDDLTRFKINSLHDEDIEVNDNLIWGKIEEELDKKTKIRVLAWRKIATAACLILLLGGSIFLINKNSINELSNIKPPKASVAKAPLYTKNDFEKKPKTTDNKYITLKKRKINVIKEERLNFTVKQIEQRTTIALETPKAVFKPIELSQTLTQIPQKSIPKMRVIHISEYQETIPELFVKPKTFYFQYAQTDIQQIIKNQTSVIPYSRSNIQN